MRRWLRRVVRGDVRGGAAEYLRVLRAGPRGYGTRDRLAWLVAATAPWAVVAVVLAVVVGIGSGVLLAGAASGDALAVVLAVYAALATVALVAAVAAVVVTRQRATGRSFRPGRRRRERAAGDPDGKLRSAVGRGRAVRVAEHDAVHRPVATVVVACFNDAHLLGAALHSVQGQSVEDWECIVVDDGSTDESADVALLFADRDLRFTVVRHETNRGLAAARNTGLGLARSELVTFLDSDDFLYERSLEERLSRVPTDPACAGVYCDWRSVDEDAPCDAESGRAAAERGPVHLLVSPWSSPFIASAPLLRVALLRAAGGFDEELRTAEDLELWARLMRGGTWFAYAPYVGVAYRQRRNSMVRRSPLGHLDVVRAVGDALTRPWDDPWPGAPAPLLEPVAASLREYAVLPRALNFLALHVAQFGADDVPDRYVPSAAMTRLADFDDLLTAEVVRADRRLGRKDAGEDARVAGLVRAVCDRATPQAGAPQVLAEAASAQPTGPDPVWTAAGARGRRFASPVETRPLRSLPADQPVLLLVPQARYHVEEVGPLLVELRAAGVPAEAYLPPSAPGGVLAALAAYTDHVYRGDAADLEGRSVIGAVVLNDWGPETRPVIEAAARAGGVSFAKVEGVQDFGDADTGWERHAYRTADIVLGQGENDVEALPGRDVRVVGSTRLERIWHGPEVDPANERALVNYNFTYGVLPDAQETWLRAAVRGARAAGVDYTVSVHPAQRNIPGDPAVQDHIGADPFSHLLRGSGVLVSRFSTVLFEAMAAGVPTIYFNPHGERVPTFARPDGAFLAIGPGGGAVQPADALRDAVREALGWRGRYREVSRAFFCRQVDVAPEPSHRRAALVVREELARRGLV